MSLEKAYFDIKAKFENVLALEPFDVVRTVDNHRNFWKPEKVRILLLAESHVHTSIIEHENVMRYDDFPELIGCPTNYVKLVYCLGYGERKLVNLTDKGTPQFWKIFVSCVNEDFHYEGKKILISKTLNFHQRLRNKISILEELKEKGIWLVDASIIALYKGGYKPTEKVMKEVSKISWEQYISKVIHKAKPEKIIVIGIGVSTRLEDELNKTNIPFHVQPQPNARLSRNDIEKSFEKYYELCNC